MNRQWGADPALQSNTDKNAGNWLQMEKRTRRNIGLHKHNKQRIIALPYLCSFPHYPQVFPQAIP